MSCPIRKVAGSNPTVKRLRYYPFSTSKYWFSISDYRGKGTYFPCSQFRRVLTSTPITWTNSSFVKPWNKGAFLMRWAKVFSGYIPKQPRYPMETRGTLANIRKFGSDALNLSVSKFLMATSDNPVTTYRSRMVILFATLAGLKRAPELFPDHWWPNNHTGIFACRTRKISRLLSARFFCGSHSYTMFFTPNNIKIFFISNGWTYPLIPLKCGSFWPLKTINDSQRA